MQTEVIDGIDPHSLLSREQGVLGLVLIPFRLLLLII